MSQELQHTQLIRQFAKNLGFTHCGIAAAKLLDADAKRLEQWLNKGYHGSMQYMENHFELRIDPTKLVPGAKSVITLLLNYFPEETQIPAAPKVARYAFGKDYHEVIRKKLKVLLNLINENIGEVNGRGFVDSAPVLERTWAKLSGLGWVGKNGNLINKQQGSYFFIATLITDLPLQYDDPFIRDYCGTCTRCIEACPTDAILPGKVVDGSKCISYFTIELKESIPKSYESKMDGWAFGCDVCQDVCPWNKFSKPHQEEKFKPIKELMNLSKDDWKEITEDVFKEIAKESPLLRPGLEKIKNTIQFTLHNGGKPA